MVTEIEVISISGQDAIAELSFALREAAETGFHPLLMGDADDYERILEWLEEGPLPETILNDSQELDPAQFLESDCDNELLEQDDGEVDVAGYRGIITHLDPTTGRPKSRVLIRNFKVPASWHVFAHLAWGGWNSCPSAKVHCAVHRCWDQRYGATVISVTSSEVQCMVENPPTDYESALQLAREQMAYSGDTATSVSALARTLINAKYWYFQWD